MITLVPMTEEEFAVFVSHAIEEYAKDHVAAGNWRADEALEKSRKEFTGYLPEGVRTPKNWLFTLLNEAGEKVGFLWYAVHPNRADLAFIYDFEIYAPFRRRGYGREALAALEPDAKAHGLQRIQLHVFGHNAAARDLYRKAGFEETDVIMAKSI